MMKLIILLYFASQFCLICKNQLWKIADILLDIRCRAVKMAKILLLCNMGQVFRTNSGRTQKQNTQTFTFYMAHSIINMHAHSIPKSFFPSFPSSFLLDLLSSFSGCLLCAPLGSSVWSTFFSSSWLETRPSRRSWWRCWRLPTSFALREAGRWHHCDCTFQSQGNLSNWPASSPRCTCC